MTSGSACPRQVEPTDPNPTARTAAQKASENERVKAARAKAAELEARLPTLIGSAA